MKAQRDEGREFSGEELAEALRALESVRQKCEKILPKMRAGSSQDTLLRRRLRAIEIACALIRRESGEKGV